MTQPPDRADKHVDALESMVVGHRDHEHIVRANAVPPANQGPGVAMATRMKPLGVDPVVDHADPIDRHGMHVHEVVGDPL